MDNLSEVNYLIRVGKKAEAWNLLNQVLTSNPKNEEAWILAYELAKPNARNKIIKRALTYAPNSLQLNKLAETYGIKPKEHLESLGQYSEGKLRSEAQTHQLTQISEPLLRPRISDAQTYQVSLVKQQPTGSANTPRSPQTISDRLASRGYTSSKPTATKQPIQATAISSGSEFNQRKTQRGWAIVGLLLCPICATSSEGSGNWIVPLFFGSLLLLFIISSTNDIRAYESFIEAKKSDNDSEYVVQDFTSYSGTGIRCPECGSTKTFAREQSFNIGKSVIGGVLLGPVGFLSGFLGRNPLEAICELCGHKWFVRGHY